MNTRHLCWAAPNCRAFLPVCAARLVLAWDDGHRWLWAMTERHEFASPPWVAALGEILESLDLAGITFAHCEELTDAPAHLCPPGQSTAAFYYRITEGTVEV